MSSIWFLFSLEFIHIVKERKSNELLSFATFKCGSALTPFFKSSSKDNSTLKIFINALPCILVSKSEQEVATELVDHIQELSDIMQSKYAELEDKHALEIMQLVRQKKAYDMKLDQVGLEETERRVKKSLYEQRYRAGYTPSASEV